MSLGLVDCHARAGDGSITPPTFPSSDAAEKSVGGDYVCDGDPWAKAWKIADGAASYSSLPAASPAQEKLPCYPA